MSMTLVLHCIFRVVTLGDWTSLKSRLFSFFFDKLLLYHQIGVKKRFPYHTSSSLLPDYKKTHCCRPRKLKKKHEKRRFTSYIKLFYAIISFMLRNNLFADQTKQEKLLTLQGVTLLEHQTFTIGRSHRWAWSRSSHSFSSNPSSLALSSSGAAAAAALQLCGASTLLHLFA